MRPPSPRWLAFGAAAVLLADAPGAFTRGDLLRRVLLPLLAALSLAVGARQGARPARLTVLAILPLGIPLAAILALPRESEHGLLTVLRETSTWGSLALLSLGLLRSLARGEDAALLGRLLLLAGAVASVWTLADGLARGGAGAGPFGRPGIAGPVLGALLAAAVATGGRGRPVLLLLLAAGLAVTRSRTGLLAGGFSALFAWTLTAGPVAARRLRSALPLVALGMGVLGALAIGGRIPVPGGGETTEVRLGLYRASFDLIAERPFTGHGLGSFPGEVLRRRDAEEARISAGRRPDQAHADVLHVSVEGGVGAGACLLAWLVGVGAVGLAARRRAAEAGGRRALDAALAVLAGLGIASLGEDVFLDPAPTLLAAAAAGTALAAARRNAPSASRVETALLLALAALPLAAAWAEGRAALADHELRAYRDRIRGGVTAAEAQAAARRHLVEGALAWRPDHPEARYRLGVSLAKSGRLEEARREFRAALAVDPGRTEARLDIARTYEIEGRIEDARETLREARRRDPTRYDVPLRLGHLAFGPEPVPGDGVDPSFDPIPPMRAWNEAAALDPHRFENLLAEARLARRRGDLAQAGALVEAAAQRAPRAAEVRTEAFRWIEAKALTLPEGRERGETLLTALSELVEALVANPDVAGEVRVEAERFLGEGERREAEARDRAAEDPRRFAIEAARRAFAAAALRLSALVRVGLPPEAEVLRLARSEASERRFRRSLARYQALLPWQEQPGRVDPRDPSSVARLADLYLEAAKVAARTDGALSRVLYARGHVAIALEHLLAGRSPEARETLERMLADGQDTAEVRWLLAKATSRMGDRDVAADHLRRALEEEPARASAVSGDPDLADLRTP